MRADILTLTLIVTALAALGIVGLSLLMAWIKGKG